MEGVLHSVSESKERMPSYLGKVLRDVSTYLFDLGTSERNAKLEQAACELDEIAVSTGGSRKEGEIAREGHRGISAASIEKVLRISRELGELGSQNGYAHLPDLSFLLSQLVTCMESVDGNEIMYRRILEEVLEYDAAKINGLGIFSNGRSSGRFN